MDIIEQFLNNCEQKNEPLKREVKPEIKKETNVSNNITNLDDFLNLLDNNVYLGSKTSTQQSERLIPTYSQASQFEMNKLIEKNKIKENERLNYEQIQKEKKEKLEKDLENKIKETNDLSVLINLLK